MGAALQWTGRGNRRQSACGRYVVWIQGRPLHGSAEWAAAVLTPDGSGSHNGGDMTWLTALEGNVSAAKQVCADHLRSQ